jgi:hypothetical protein
VVGERLVQPGVGVVFRCESGEMTVQRQPEQVGRQSSPRSCSLWCRRSAGRCVRWAAMNVSRPACRRAGRRARHPRSGQRRVQISSAIMVAARRAPSVSTSR